MRCGTAGTIWRVSGRRWAGRAVGREDIEGRNQKEKGRLPATKTGPPAALRYPPNGESNHNSLCHRMDESGPDRMRRQQKHLLWADAVTLLLSKLPRLPE